MSKGSSGTSDLDDLDGVVITVVVDLKRVFRAATRISVIAVASVRPAG
jgi:hypothetical protein